MTHTVHTRSARHQCVTQTGWPRMSCCSWSVEQYFMRNKCNVNVKARIDIYCRARGSERTDIDFSWSLETAVNVSRRPLLPCALLLSKSLRSSPAPSPCHPPSLIPVPWLDAEPAVWSAVTGVGLRNIFLERYCLSNWYFVKTFFSLYDLSFRRS